MGCQGHFGPLIRPGMGIKIPRLFPPSSREGKGGRRKVFLEAAHHPASETFELKSSFGKKAIAKVELFPGSFPFGSFEGVYGFDNFRSFFSNDVRSQIAVSGRPFCCRVRASDAVLSRRKYNGSLATLAAIYYRIAFPPVVRAPLLAHEGALPAYFNNLANHLSTS